MGVAPSVDAAKHSGSLGGSNAFPIFMGVAPLFLGNGEAEAVDAAMLSPSLWGLPLGIPEDDPGGHRSNAFPIFMGVARPTYSL